jgi:glycosyltransferase involved in cell wall biosynthesis
MDDDRIKVLFVMQDLSRNGAVMAVLNLLRHLDRERFEIVLYVLRRAGVCLSEVPEDVRLVAASRKHRYSKYLTPYYLLRLWGQARKCDVIVGASSLRMTYLAYVAGWLARKPVVGSIQVVMDKWLQGCRRWNTRAVRFIYPRLARCVCVSKGTVRGLLNAAPIKPENVRLAYDGYEVDRFVAGSDEEVPEWYAELLRKPTLIAIGRFSEEKGFDLLIEAHAQVLQKNIDHNLLIIGSGPLRRELEGLVHRLGVTGSVHMPGHVPNLYPLLKNATAFMLSSRHEGFPGVVIEALALGTPVVATACGGPIESLSEGKYGILVEPEDVASLADGITTILSDHVLREKYATAGPERAAWYRPETRVGDWETILCEVCGCTTPNHTRQLQPQHQTQS